MRYIKIRQATKQGYIECPTGGVLNIALPSSTTRRGRVIENGTIAPTLDTGCEVGVVVEVKQIGQLYGTDREPNPKAGRIYDEGGVITDTWSEQRGQHYADGEDKAVPYP